MNLKQAISYFYKHPSPWCLVAICVSFCVLRSSLDVPFHYSELLLGGGVLLYWPFQEWWMHRWLLHMGSITIFGKTFEPDFTRTHRLHHEKPDDMDWVFLPVAHILSSLILFSGILYLCTFSIRWTSVFMIFASFSTVLYEWTHYLTHTTYRPKSKYYKKIWQLHRWHHFKHEGYWFSFTIPYIDGWFGTGPKPSEVKKSPTARTLGGDPFGA